VSTNMGKTERTLVGMSSTTTSTIGFEPTDG
jgi:hypothetical protein